jgi:hypothetical protein
MEDRLWDRAALKRAAFDAVELAEQRARKAKKEAET